jgi:hypothetical protein
VKANDLAGATYCRHCGHRITREIGGWYTPIGEPPAPGVALPNECPARPLEGFTATFLRHEP